MSQQQINIGTGPSSGDGDPLRTAFNKINTNFTEVYSNIVPSGTTVNSVAGRTGNISLTTQDITGINNYVKTVGSPATSIGGVGDAAGLVAFDATYIYYCTATYDGVADIWKRVSWSVDTW